MKWPHGAAMDVTFFIDAAVPVAVHFKTAMWKGTVS